MEKITEWFDLHFVPEWREAWKRWSLQFAALLGTAVTTILADPGMLFTIVNYLPADPSQRAVAAVGIGAAVWLAPSVLALLKQKKLGAGDNDAAG